MRRTPVALITGLFAAALLTATSLVPSSPVAAAPIADAPTTLCADPDTDPLIETSQAGGMITCDTTITNNITAIDPITGVASGNSVIRVTECTGPANGRLDPNDLTCVTDLQVLTELVTHVDQCNGVGYGGGAVLECNVDVINNFIGVTPEALGAATVNQCNGSAPVTTGCNPFPATTTNATITQCNGSSYGGGQEDFNCIASGTTTASLSVTVNQCNDSNYGGGSWLNCSADLSNVITQLPTEAPTLPPTEAPTLPPTEAPTLPPTLPPTEAPTLPPTEAPTLPPEATPTPTLAPEATPTPTLAPEATPTPTPITPEATATPTLAPEATPTTAPLPDTATGSPPVQPFGGLGFLVVAAVLGMALIMGRLLVGQPQRRRL